MTGPSSERTADADVAIDPNEVARKTLEQRDPPYAALLSVAEIEAMAALVARQATNIEALYDDAETVASDALALVAQHRDTQEALAKAADDFNLIRRTIHNSKSAPNVWESLSDFASWGEEAARAALSGSGATGEKCAARRSHPLSLDYYVECVLGAGHEGQHTTTDDVRWDDGSKYALPRATGEEAER